MYFTVLLDGAVGFMGCIISIYGNIAWMKDAEADCWQNNALTFECDLCVLCLSRETPKASSCLTMCVTTTTCLRKTTLVFDMWTPRNRGWISHTYTCRATEVVMSLTCLFCPPNSLENRERGKCSQFKSTWKYF